MTTNLFVKALRLLCFVTAAGLIATMPALADQGASYHSETKPSSADAAACQARHQAGAAVAQAAAGRTPRAAGSSPVSPAMALALALGVRNISGPMMKTGAAPAGDAVCKTMS